MRLPPSQVPQPNLSFFVDNNGDDHHLHHHHHHHNRHHHHHPHQYHHHHDSAESLLHNRGGFGCNNQLVVNSSPIFLLLTWVGECCIVGGIVF